MRKNTHNLKMQRKRRLLLKQLEENAQKRCKVVIILEKIMDLCYYNFIKCNEFSKPILRLLKLYKNNENIIKRSLQTLAVCRVFKWSKILDELTYDKNYLVRRLAKEVVLDFNWRKKITVKEFNNYFKDYQLKIINWKFLDIHGYDSFKILYGLVNAESNDYKKVCLVSMYFLYKNLLKQVKESNKVVILVDYQKIDDSRVFVFKDKGEYLCWCNRKSKFQTWKKTKKANPLIKQLNLKEYKRLKETHYKEIIHDEDLPNGKRINDLWFYE